jgi:adenosylcobalamin-dependent ribonucleoside-triphosphate reductase
MINSSARAQIIYRRTYSREKDDGRFETWGETITRVIQHQQWLWERAKGKALSNDDRSELAELKRLMLDRKVLVAGRTLWLGGTEIAKRREASQFNCSHIKVETVHDAVDVLWLLLQGCGVGFTPVFGTLSGFATPIKNIVVKRSERTTKGGVEQNIETWDTDSKTWTIKVGDSAEAWAKSIGKLLAGKYPADTLVLDFAEIRPAGERLKGYGWISAGDASIARAYRKIADILNARSGQLLRKMDLLDVINLLGTVLSSRRSAEIALVEHGSPEWREFAYAKKDFWVHDNQHRQQSNNSLVFFRKPSIADLHDIFHMITEAGGSEPGLVNGAEARRRAPWFSGLNPCAEILLGNRSFCNLVEVNVAAFNDMASLLRAIYVVARANYRQTLVNLEDGILQRSWHENNEFLRLCGVGLTGLVRRPDLTPYDLRQLRNAAVFGAYSMADELGFQRPKNVTTVKPSGTLSKVMDTTEGIHKPLGRFILNNVVFSKHEPIVGVLGDAGYHVVDHPDDPSSCLVTFPVEWVDVPFDNVGGKYVNIESAVSQLTSYKVLMDNYVDQNCSITVSYDQDEIPDIIEWMHDNWDSYVGVSFLYRTDPTKTAKDLGYAYLPQEVVDEGSFREYQQRLRPIDTNVAQGVDELVDDECLGGVCPIK